MARYLPCLNSVRCVVGPQFCRWGDWEREERSQLEVTTVCNDRTRIFKLPFVLCFDFLVPVHLPLHIADVSVLVAWEGKRRERNFVNFLLRTFSQQRLRPSSYPHSNGYFRARHWTHLKGIFLNKINSNLLVTLNVFPFLASYSLNLARDILDAAKTQ